MAITVLWDANCAASGVPVPLKMTRITSLGSSSTTNSSSTPLRTNSSMTCFGDLITKTTKTVTSTNPIKNMARYFKIFPSVRCSNLI